jgi:hypothetical protein
VEEDGSRRGREGSGRQVQIFRLALSGLLPSILLAYFFVRFAIRQDWLGAGTAGGFLAIFIVMILWRLRSGIPSWTFLATVVGLVGNIRPTRHGLVRKGEKPSFSSPQRPATESFDSLAQRLHASVDPSKSGPTDDDPDRPV